jgi:ABC-type transport system involved in multi-copper enzyme maturation permease subunit
VIPQTRAELLKIRSTRTTLGLVLGMVALMVLFLLLHGLLSNLDELDGKENQRDLLGFGSIAGLFGALAGVLVVTCVYRFGTIRPTFLFSPGRSWLIRGKLAAGILTGLVLAIVGEGLTFGIGYAILSGRDISIVLGGGDIALLVLGVLMSSALWGGIGVGLAAILRNQVGSVIGLLFWVFAVENLLFGFVPSVGRFAPSQATNSLIGLTSDHLLAPAAGGAVLVAWLVTLAAAGVAITARRDVN